MDGKDGRRGKMYELSGATVIVSGGNAKAGKHVDPEDGRRASDQTSPDNGREKTRRPPNLLAAEVQLRQVSTPGEIPGQLVSPKAYASEEKWRTAERMHVHVGAAWGIVSADTDLDAGASLTERLLHQRLEDDQKLLERKLQHDQTLLDQVLLDQRFPRPEVMELLPVASCMVSLRF